MSQAHIEGAENLQRILLLSPFFRTRFKFFFGLLASRMISAQPNSAHEAIGQYARSRQQLSIVTTNYDCCMDLALSKSGKDFEYIIDFTNVQAAPEEKTQIELIKLHGSLNWYYCETCQEVQLVDIRKTVKEFLDDVSPYPVIGICKDCGGQPEGYLYRRSR